MAAVGETIDVDTDGVWDLNGYTFVRFEYQWYRGGVAVANATSRLYTPSTDDEGETLTLGVTLVYTNGSGLEFRSPEDLSNTFGPIEAAEGGEDPILPVTTADVLDPTVAGTPQVSQTQTITVGTAGGTAPITWDGVVQRADSASGPWSDAAGSGWTGAANGSTVTYTPVSADIGKVLRAKSTPENSAGTGATVYSTATSIIASLAKQRYGFRKSGVGGNSLALSPPGFTVPASGFTVLSFAKPEGGGTRRALFAYDDGVRRFFQLHRSSGDYQITYRDGLGGMPSLTISAADFTAAGFDPYDGVERCYWVTCDNDTGTMTAGVTGLDGTTLVSTSSAIGGGGVPVGEVTGGSWPTNPVLIGNHPNLAQEYEGHLSCAVIDRVLPPSEIEAVTTLDDVYIDPDVQICPRTEGRLGVSATSAVYADEAGAYTWVGDDGGEAYVTEVGTRKTRLVLLEGQSNAEVSGVSYTGGGVLGEFNGKISQGSYRAAVDAGDSGPDISWLIEEGATPRQVIKRYSGGTSIQEHIDTIWPLLEADVAAYGCSLEGAVMVWAQGERDSRTSGDASAYAGRLDTLVALWKAAGVTGYVLCGVPPLTAAGYDFVGEVNSAMLAKATADSDGVYVSSDTLTLQADGIHLDEASTLQRGTDVLAQITTQNLGAPAPVWDAV